MQQPPAEREEEPDGEISAVVRHRKSIGSGDEDEAMRVSCGVASQAPISLQSMAPRTTRRFTAGREELSGRWRLAMDVKQRCGRVNRYRRNLA